MKILRLPLVVERKLIPMLDTRDVIDLSFKCKAFRRMMRSTKLPCKSLKWFFRPRPGITIGYGYRKLKIRLHMRRVGDAFSDCGEVGSKTIAPSQCRFIRCEPEPVNRRGFACRRYNMFLKSNRGVHPIDIMEMYTSVLMDIFIPEEFRITWDLDNLNVFFNLSVWGITKKFSTVKFITDSISNPENFPNAVTFLNDQIEAERMLFKILDSDNLPSIQLLLKQKRMKIVDSFCFDFETYLNMECQFFELEWRQEFFELEDLKRVIHSWIAGRLPNLKSFIAKGSIDEENKVAQVTEGIETYKVTDKPDYSIFHANDWEENAVEIIRDFDKRKASIFLNKTEFALIIWQADGVLWKRDYDDDDDGKRDYDTVERVIYWNSGEDDDN